jgi:hypothetical protein
MIRIYLTHDRVVGFAHQHPRGLLPPLAQDQPEPPAIPFLGVRARQFQQLRQRAETEWVPALQQIVEIETPSLPVIWDIDLLYGTKTPAGEDTYILCEINVSSTFAFPEQALGAVATATVKRVQAHRDRAAQPALAGDRWHCSSSRPGFREGEALWLAKRGALMAVAVERRHVRAGAPGPHVGVGSSSERAHRCALGAAVLGGLALLSGPCVFELSRLGSMPLITGAYLFPLPVVLGIAALYRSRRTQRSPLLALKDPRGRGLARLGGRLGVIAIYLGLTVGLAVGFFWLLTTSSR